MEERNNDVKVLARQLRICIRETTALAESLRRCPPPLESNRSLIRRAILIMSQRNRRSEIFKRLDSRTLYGLCHRLLTPRLTGADALRWLLRQPTGSNIKSSALYRFSYIFADVVTGIIKGTGYPYSEQQAVKSNRNPQATNAQNLRVSQPGSNTKPRRLRAGRRLLKRRKPA